MIVSVVFFVFEIVGFRVSEIGIEFLAKLLLDCCFVFCVLILLFWCYLNQHKWFGIWFRLELVRLVLNLS